MRGSTVFILVVAVAAFYLYVSYVSPESISGEALPVPEQQEAPAGGTLSVTLTTDRQVWAYKFLTRLGNQNPTLETIAAVVSWQGGEGSKAAFNPLATTQPMPGNTCFNSLASMPCGVKNYVSEEQGLEASVITLTSGYYPTLLAGLLNNDPNLFFSADSEFGTWGAGKALSMANYDQAVADLYALVENTQPIVAYAEPITEPAPIAGDAQTIVKCPFTDTMQIGEGSNFWDTGAAAWGGQYGGYHLGNDYIGQRGDLVYAPYDMTVKSVGGYWDPGDGRYGGNLTACFDMWDMCMYAGHFVEIYVQPGQDVPACTPIGALGATTWPHVHITFRTNTAPCEGNKPEEPGGCYDPYKFWMEH